MASSLQLTSSYVTKSSYPGPLDYYADRSTLSKLGGTIDRTKPKPIVDIRPGPGQYDVTKRNPKHASAFTFNSRGLTDVERLVSRKGFIPGPRYLHTRPVNKYRGKFSSSKRQTLWNPSDSSRRTYPAPHEYQDFNLLPRKISHGIISESRPKSELDYALIRSASTPAMDRYGIGSSSDRYNKLGYGISAGEFSTAFPKTTFEQAIFDKRENPGPGTYDIVKNDPGGKINGGKIGHGNPLSDVEWKILKASREPGPDEYDVGSTLSTVGGKFFLGKRDIDFGSSKDAAEIPGPNAYDVRSSLRSGGAGKISDANPKSELEISILRAQETPGPSEYQLNRDFVSGIKGGRISQAKVKTVLEEHIFAAREIPGVGEYTINSPFKKRKGVNFGSAAERWVDKTKAIHYSESPGPGDYMHSNKVSSFGRQVSSTFVNSRSASMLQRYDVPDDRLKYNNGPGSYKITDGIGKQVLAHRTSMPNVSFPKGVARPPDPNEKNAVPHGTAYDAMAALDKLMKQTPATGEQANYKARLAKARINRWKWRSKYNFN